MAVMLTVGKKKPPAKGYGTAAVLQQGYGPGGPPKKPPAPKKPAYTQAQVNASLAANPQSTMGPSFGVNYAMPAGTIKVARQRPDFMPTVAGMIPGDYEVQDAETMMADRMAQLRSGFTKNIRQALVNLGVTDTSKLGQFGSYIDADTITQAAANKYSTAAQIAEQETTQRAKAEATLAARGILHSGATTGAAADIAAEGEKGRFAALQDFLGAGEQGLGGIAEQEYGLSQQVARARAAAAQRAAEQYWYEWGGGDEYEQEVPAPVGGTSSTFLPAKPKPVPKPKPKPSSGYGTAARLQAGYGPGGPPKPAAKPKKKK